MITLKLTDPISVIQDKVNAAFADEINKLLSANITKLLSQCKELVDGWILSQREITSLLSSDPTSLAGQFGIPSGNENAAVNAIVNAVKGATTIKFVKFSKKLKGGVEVYFQPSNFVNLLGLPQGHVRYGDGDLHWLDWLLTKGDKIIVANYEYNPQTGLGRSNLGNMVPGGSFRVPPEFSGIESNNFITRALLGKEQEQQITSIFKKILGGK